MNALLDNEQQAVRNMHWSFFGCYMQQTPNAVLSLNRLLNAENFDTIIELGTHDGGLSSLFALYCLGSRMFAQAEDPREPSLYKNNTHHKSPKQFYTFDYVLRDIPRTNLLLQMGTVFKKIDFLNDKSNIEYIGGLIRDGRRTLVLCDGGDKPKEFRLFAPFLKSNDIIMAHDWAATEEDYVRVKEARIWYGWETKWEWIKEACESNHIEQIYQEEFDRSVWFCGRKR